MPLGLKQGLAANNVRDQRRFLGPVGNGAVDLLRVVVMDNAQKLSDRGLASDVAATQDVEFTMGTGSQGDGGKDLGQEGQTRFFLRVLFGLEDEAQFREGVVPTQRAAHGVAYLGLAGADLGVKVAFDGGDTLVDASRQRQGRFVLLAVDGADGLLRVCCAVALLVNQVQTLIAAAAWQKTNRPGLSTA